MNPGDTISRYRIVGRIGRGGMGVVYRAEDTRLRRPVALKFLPDSLDEGSKHRFLNEARAAALARHPNICPIHDIEEADGEIFLVMALIEGETLSRRIARGPIPPAEAAAIAAQAAAGLAAAHDLGIVHRDIKSSNIMIDASGHVSIMDFGLALAPEALRLTGEGASVGTPDYMSPEQAKGEPVDARTDLWSLGVVLFEMLAGRLPFRREHRAALIHALLTEPVPDLPGVPDDLRGIVAKALQKEREYRWPTAHAMAGALKGEPEEPQTLTETIVAAIPRRRRLWPAIVAAAVVLLAAGGFGLYRFGAKTPTLPAAKHIAMLPLAADNPAIANGLVDALTAALSGQPSVTVAPSSRTIATVEAARKYHGVNLALTWSAKPDGDAVQFKVDLIDAASRKQIDTRTIRYDPKAPIVSRDQAVSQVFRMLKLEAPTVREPERSAPEAYSSYLEGRGYLARYDMAGNIEKAIASFVKSTSQNPNYALAYAGLAEAHWRKSLAERDAKWMAIALQNAEHAARLDSQLAMAHAILGSVYRDSGQEANAIREFQRALELAPRNAEAARQLAEIHSTLGRFEEAETLYLSSTKSRPTDWYGHFLLGLFYIRRQRYEEAIAALNQSKEIAQDNDLVRYNLGRAYRSTGRYAEAIAELQKALRIRSSPLVYAALGGVYYFQHLFPEAVSALDTAIDLAPETYWFWGNLGIYCKWAPGNEGKSQAALRKAIELGVKEAEADKPNYSVLANVAEYRARLGDTKGALADLERIPESARAALTTRYAIVYELSGQRDRAIAVVRRNLKSPAELNQIKDDPDLAAIWQAVR